MEGNPRTRDNSPSYKQGLSEYMICSLASFVNNGENNGAKFVNEIEIYMQQIFVVFENFLSFYFYVINDMSCGVCFNLTGVTLEF